MKRRKFQFYQVNTKTGESAQEADEPVEHGRTPLEEAKLRLSFLCILATAFLIWWFCWTPEATVLLMQMPIQSRAFLIVFVLLGIYHSARYEIDLEKKRIEMP